MGVESCLGDGAVFEGAVQDIVDAYIFLAK